MSAALPPIICVVGRRNSGKTTLLVALAAELKRRGLRVASVKHSHHELELDEPGKDSWRHFHEGGVEAVTLASPGRLAFFMRLDSDVEDPTELVRRFYAGDGYDLVLVEAFTDAPLPRIEIFRTAVHGEPLFPLTGEQPHRDGARDGAGAGRWLAVVTDVPQRFDTQVPAIRLDSAGLHVQQVAELVLRELGRHRRLDS
jgi:molybdopterin-guanine dinucleotide biosynthesis protein MobB